MCVLKPLACIYEICRALLFYRPVQTYAWRDRADAFTEIWPLTLVNVCGILQTVTWERIDPSRSSRKVTLALLPVDQSWNMWTNVSKNLKDRGL